MELFKTILVPYDLSKSSDRALEYAANLANLSNDCHIIILHIIPTFPIKRPHPRGERIVSSASADSLQRIYEELEVNASKILNTKKEDWRMKNFSTSTHIAVADNAAKKIVEYAKRHGVDLIVMNSRSTAPKNRIKGMLWFPLGSVSRNVSEMAPCPVLLIRPT